MSLLMVLALAAAPAAAQRRKPAPAPVVAPAPPPTVRTGVDLWRAGDWAGAVAIWQPFAAAGDADAMFNMGQAYKLGRAVPVDKAVARDWYRKAAAKDHLPAQANLGILLFQAGEKPEAARWLKAAADRGEMRAQYVLGVAHWNGDGVPRSMPLAYAYLARASAQGLTEATGALNNLTRTIAPVDRANGWAIATSLAAGNGVPANFAVAAAPAKAGAVTAADLNRQTLEAVQKPLPVARPAAPAPQVLANAGAPAPAATRQAPVGVPPEAPKPVVVAAAPPVVPPLPSTAPAVRKVELPPTSVAAGTTATASAENVVAKPVEPTKLADKPVTAPKSTDKPAEKPATKTADAAKATDKPAKAAAEPTGWRVQLGAFGQKSQAETAWTEIKTKQKAVVGTAKPIYSPGKSIVKLQMGPYKTRTEAKDACAKLAFAGRACFVTEG